MRARNFERFAAGGPGTRAGCNDRLLCLAAALTASIALGPAGPAAAAPVSFACGGVIQSVVDTHGVLDGSIVPAGRLRCEVHYDAPGTDSFAGDPNFGFYPQNPPTGRLLVAIGSYRLVVPMSIPVRFGVLDDWRGGPSEPFIDSFAWSMEGANFPFPGTPDTVVEQISFAMDTLDTAVLASDALPLAVLDVADFPNQETRRFGITGCREAELTGTFCTAGRSIAIYGIIDTLPEPGAMASGLACLGVLGTLSRRGSAFRSRQ